MSTLLDLQKAILSQMSLVHPDSDLSADMPAAVACLHPLYMKFELSKPRLVRRSSLVRHRSQWAALHGDAYRRLVFGFVVNHGFPVFDK
jgi:hypothetical protein